MANCPFELRPIFTHLIFRFFSRKLNRFHDLVNCVCWIEHQWDEMWKFEVLVDKKYIWKLTFLLFFIIWDWMKKFEDQWYFDVKQPVFLFLPVWPNCSLSNHISSDLKLPAFSMFLICRTYHDVLGIFEKQTLPSKLFTATQFHDFGRPKLFLTFITPYL